MRPETPSEIKGDYKSCELLHKCMSKTPATASHTDIEVTYFSRRAQIFRPDTSTTTSPYPPFVAQQILRWC
jgi:hypothetical protein